MVDGAHFRPFRLDELLAVVDRDGGPGEEPAGQGPQCRDRDGVDSHIGASSILLGRMSAHRTIRWIFAASRTPDRLVSRSLASPETRTTRIGRRQFTKSRRRLDRIDEGGRDTDDVQLGLEQPESSEPYDGGSSGGRDAGVANHLRRAFEDHAGPVPNGTVIASVRRQATDFEQLKPEGFDLGEHAVQRGLVRQCSGQHGVLSARPSPEGGER
jgi:hypothetical protein